jgi:cysteinyl-tRNA synthetase
MNITDVGHLVGDGDLGEDKIAAGAKKEHTTPEEIASRYTKLFIDDLRTLNVDTDAILFPKATEYLEEQIKLIQELEKHRLTYNTKSGVYFDTEQFPGYGKLHGLMTMKLIGGARVSMDDGRRGIHDFALWRFAKKNDLQKWDSPWGVGNPGWSIECSAMAMSLLGAELDIHTGGEDLASIHHNNEIAQSEGATKRPFVRYWLHSAFLNVGGDKMSKSLDNLYTLADIKERGYHPLSLRYLYLQAHYKSPLSFSFESLSAAEEALKKLWKWSRAIEVEAKGKTAHSDADTKFVALLRDDLSTAQALAHLFAVLPDEEYTAEEKLQILRSADAILGLGLLTPPEEETPIPLSELPDEVRDIAEKREEARKHKDFTESDTLRIHLLERGYRVEDGSSGSIYSRTK